MHGIIMGILFIKYLRNNMAVFIKFSFTFLTGITICYSLRKAGCYANPGLFGNTYRAISRF